MLSILHGNVLDRLKDIPDNAIQCVITSPPYFGLRNYDIPETIWPDDWTGCLGNEPTPQLFVQHLTDVFRETKRVLREDGILFLNIGDSYSNNKAKGIKNKGLLLVPERLAIALQEDGWFIRSRIAWTKGYVLPESVTDRPTSSWEHIWMCTKNSKYYWDKTAGLEPLAGSPENLNTTPGEGTSGRNMRNVWHMNPQPLKEAHFATFPKSLPTKAIQVATSEAGCCPTCRSPYKRVIEKGEPDKEHQALCGADSSGGYNGLATKDYTTAKAQDPSATKARILAGMVKKVTIGWNPTCGCPVSPPVPCLVLDPFAGAGTTLLAAKELGRDAIGIELNPDYIKIAENRLGTEVWSEWMW